MPDARSQARATILATAMSLEPQPLDLLQLRVVPPVRRVVDHVAPPLDMTVLQFRYREGGGGIEPLPPRHTHACTRKRRRY